jgi:hypothetical protein
MTKDTQGGRRKHTKLWLALAAVAVILAVVIVPPLVSVSRYKARITQLISASLGRPVRLSSVEVRLLPRPGFVLSDLTVDEDPAYGAEPVLHASTVTAPIRLLSLWRGRLEIDSINVDEASVNLVRTKAGHWNLDSLLRTAATQSVASAVSQHKPLKLPFLAATNSRINIKDGVEKLPFSLVEAQISFWQESNGDWRVRLRGQPVRTDISLEMADTGIVRLEATLHQAAQLRQMPVHLDLEWRDAQLGQLTRLILGSDSGWRGGLNGELHLDGTADAAQIKTRLRASGVHREEFAPAEPLDFDANCSFVGHFTSWAIDNLVCDSPLGSGRIRLTGDLPGQDAPPHLSVELDRIPVAAGLDALRTVRSGLGPGLEASGSISGKIAYAPVAADSIPPDDLKKQAHTARARSTKTHPSIPQPLTGSLTIDGFELSGNALSQPIRIPKVVVEPAAAPQSPGDSLFPALAATATFPAGGAAPLAISTRLAAPGYQVTVRGQASVARARELAHVASVAGAAAFDSLAGEPITMDLTADGPWMPAQRLPFGGPPPAAHTGSATQALDSADSLSGTVTLHNANWKADYLANHVQISQATLHLGNGEIRWDPVAFSYGPVKGTASLTVPSVCDGTNPCIPQFHVQFGALDAAVLQAAFLGAHEPGTLLSTLLERLRPASAPAWPPFEVTVKADSLILGPVTLSGPTATLHTIATGAEITAFDGGLLGGRVHGSGTLHSAQTARDKPSYALDGQFEKISPAALGKLLGMRCSGGAVAGGGKIELAGFSGKDLAASAKGTMHFEWQHGAVAGTGTLPKALARFDRWTADGDIANGSLTLKQSQAQRGSSSVPVQASVTLAEPPKATFEAPKPAQAKR